MAGPLRPYPPPLGLNGPAIKKIYFFAASLIVNSIDFFLFKSSPPPFCARTTEIETFWGFP